MLKFSSQLITLLILFVFTGCNGSNKKNSPSHTTFSQGTITSVGNNIVSINGTEWNTTSSVITINNAQGSQSDLKLGMKAIVEGKIFENTDTADAIKIEVDYVVVGPISNTVNTSKEVTDPDSVVFTVLGIPIKADWTTVLENILLNQLGDDAVWVQISGSPSTNGEVLASWIKKIPTPNEPSVEIQGTISLVNENGSFTLESGDQNVVVGGNSDDCTSPTKHDSNMPQTEDKVEVKGMLLDDDSICASEVEIEDNIADNDADDFEIEGIVTMVDSETSSFQLGDDIMVTTDEFTQFKPMHFEVQEGMMLEVEGNLEDGKLAATEIKLESKFKLSGEVTLNNNSECNNENNDESNDETNDEHYTIEILGFTIQVTANTRVDDVSPCVNSFVEVRAVDNNGELTALRIKHTNNDRAFIEGTLTSKNKNDDEDTWTFNILQKEFSVDGNTKCENDDVDNEVSCTDFYNNIELGDRIKTTDETAPFTFEDGNFKVETEE